MAHLLVVDDEPSIRELLEISFRKEGHKVETASSGEAAKSRLAAQIFDIVVSDICMPDMDGVELLRYSKEVSPSTIFILITGVPTVETAIAAVNARIGRCNRYGKWLARLPVRCDYQLRGTWGRRPREQRFDPPSSHFNRLNRNRKSRAREHYRCPWG